eukprot:CAMPEP_0204595806 /NCGR_PEP_ID=MMETSP0661-20131031/52883_1 /ASSEMBLY_ACC=CAM_ASM_000606 /TAXON_ID=109239 /ORGANISM="Alexandrium margalefi, Strain AMGDE01CS-322" /LENGTH=142 /DNA_ID=CAMNT_0051606367 /DNA_START=61 /DNA_END=489 /DNA_ORIENTATION=-
MAVTLGMTKTVGVALPQQKPATQAAWLPEAALGAETPKLRISHSRSAILELSPRSDAQQPKSVPKTRTAMLSSPVAPRSEVQQSDDVPKTRTAMLSSPVPLRSRTSMLLVEPGSPASKSSRHPEFSTSEMGGFFTRTLKSFF